MLIPCVYPLALTTTRFSVCYVLAHMVGHLKNDERTEPDNADNPSISEIFDVLADSRRRQVLHIIDHGEDVALAQVAKEIAPHTNGPPRNEVLKKKNMVRQEVPEDSLNRITTSLHHVDIPKMEHAGLVEFDPDQKTIRATENASQLEHILAIAQSPVEDGNSR